MRRLSAIILLGLALHGGTAAAGFRVGNGGDQLRLAFAKAKEHASFVTLRVTPRSLPRNLDADVRDWLLANREALAADVAATPHEWSLDPWATCAWTQMQPAAPISFSYPTCRDALANPGNDPHLSRIGIGSMDQAGALLIHESVHHLGVNDEEFADKVALAVYDAWRSGALDWQPSARAGAPEPRLQHSAVWADDRVIIFGGALTQGGDRVTNTGYRYDPIADVWSPISSQGAPARYGHLAVWTGKQMIVWGGYIRRNGSSVWQNSGAVWDAATDSWSALSTPNGPAEFSGWSASDQGPAQSLVWTGKEIIVFGGGLSSGRLPGGVYNPESRQWRAIATAGVQPRAEHTAVWTGDRMLVWGGNEYSGARRPLDTGYSYDPAANRWSPMSTVNAPSARFLHTAVWTGMEMVVFGGFGALRDLIGTGGIYDPTTNAWTPISTEGTQMRYIHTAVWTGAEMLIFGGKSRMGATFSSVAAFNPINRAWRIIEPATAPTARELHSATWTGSSMVIFGGADAGGAPLATGGVFYP